MDIELADKKTIKECGALINGNVKKNSFCFLERSKAIKPISWCMRHFRGIVWNSGKHRSELPSIFRKDLKPEDFAKRNRSCKIHSLRQTYGRLEWSWLRPNWGSSRSQNKIKKVDWLKLFFLHGGDCHARRFVKKTTHHLKLYFLWL